MDNGIPVEVAKADNQKIIKRLAELYHCEELNGCWIESNGDSTSAHKFVLALLSEKLFRALREDVLDLSELGSQQVDYCIRYLHCGKYEHNSAYSDGCKIAIAMYTLADRFDLDGLETLAVHSFDYEFVSPSMWVEFLECPENACEVIRELDEGGKTTEAMRERYIRAFAECYILGDEFGVTKYTPVMRYIPAFAMDVACAASSKVRQFDEGGDK